MTLYTAHHLCDLLRRSCITNSPSCHRIALCKTTTCNGSVINFLTKGGNADMLLIAINKIFIHLIGNHINITLYYHISDSTKLLLRIKHSGRIVWCIQYNSLCLIGNGFFQILCLQLVALLLGGLSPGLISAVKILVRECFPPLLITI